MTVTEKDTEHVKREQEVEETGMGIAKGEKGKASKHEAGAPRVWSLACPTYLVVTTKCV